MSLICNWFDDWGRTIQNALGKSWVIVLFAAFLFISLCCLAAILRASIGKTKLVFNRENKIGLQMGDNHFIYNINIVCYLGLLFDGNILIKEKSWKEILLVY